MSLLIEDAETVAAIRRLADQDGRSPEEVVRQAVEAATERAERTARRMAALKEIQDRYASWPDTGLKADKAFFDDLGGGL